MMPTLPALVTTLHWHSRSLQSAVWLSKLCLLGLVSLCSVLAATADVVWQEDFEGPTPGWTSDTGTVAPVWEIGVPISGPGSAHQGDRVAATVLGGNYPENRTSR